MKALERDIAEIARRLREPNIFSPALLNAFQHREAIQRAALAAYMEQLERDRSNRTDK